MPHNPLTFLLQKVVKDAFKKTTAQTHNESRRKFIKEGAIIAGGIGLIPSFATAFVGDKKPVISIIGAGMAGMNAAYQLLKMGLDAKVYEASARTGGRMFTIRDKFGENITTDIGGEYVDTTHTDIIDLAKELDVHFYDLREDNHASQTFYFDGRLLSNEDLRNAILPFVEKIETDVMSLPPVINHTTAEKFQHLDKLSITEYISKLGITGWLFDFLNVVLTREYGMEASEQSAINLLIMFTQPAGANQAYELFGDEHEVLKITGGSQHLTNELQKKIKENILLNHQLQSIQKTAKGYTLDFSMKGQPKKINTDYVILAIPFTILRKLHFEVPMQIEKRNCINKLGYGNSGKFIMGVNNKPWRTAGQKGYTFSDLEFGCGWDSSLMQSEREGSFTIFGGGNFMSDICGKQNDLIAKKFNPQLGRIYPGFAKAYNKKNVKFCWGNYAHTKAGYSSFKKGQWSTLAGWEQIPVGNIYFAGEHTSLDFQGYMNGAAKTGREAAEMIAKAVSREQ
ncbi:hypothetical protein BH10BAC3_BH10BAC3_28090 [soil metagenome]